MPRRPRNPFAAPPRRNHGPVPPPPVVAAAPTYDLTKLRIAYEWMALDKLVGFKLVVEWYAASQVALLYKDPLDADRMKKMERAQLAVNQANGTNIEHEKTAAWRAAIRLFEKLWAHKAADWPLVDKIESAPLAASAHIINIQTVLSNLNGAFAPAGCKFRVTFGQEQEFLFGEILVPQADLFAMIPQTPLAVALNLVPTVAKVLSIRTVDGKQEFDGTLFMQKLPEVLNHVGVWAGAGNVNKPVGKAPKAPKAAKVPGAPRAPRVANPNAVSIKPGMTITLTGASIAKLKGSRVTVFNLISNGMAVRDLQAAAGAKIGTGWKSRSLAVLKALVTAGVITVA